MTQSDVIVSEEMLYQILDSLDSTRRRKKRYLAWLERNGLKPSKAIHDEFYKRDMIRRRLLLSFGQVERYSNCTYASAKSVLHCKEIPIIPWMSRDRRC